MDADQTLGIERAAHVIDIGFARSVEPREVAAAKRIEDPGELVLGILLQEGLVRCRRAVLQDVDGRGGVRVQRGRVEAALLAEVVVAGCGARGVVGVEVLVVDVVVFWVLGDIIERVRRGAAEREGRAELRGGAFAADSVCGGGGLEVVAVVVRVLVESGGVVVAHGELLEAVCRRELLRATGV